jgi:acyl-CoA thioester hydrolase
MNDQHQFFVRVYYEDTDFSGNVYHAAYLKFLERARTEWLRALGIHHSELMKDGLAFAVRHMEIDFEAPAKIDDELIVTTTIAQKTGARVVLDQSIHSGAELLVQGRVTAVAINQSGKPARLPKALRG